MFYLYPGYNPGIINSCNNGSPCFVFISTLKPAKMAFLQFSRTFDAIRLTNSYNKKIKSLLIFGLKTLTGTAFGRFFSCSIFYNVQRTGNDIWGHSAITSCWIEVTGLCSCWCFIHWWKGRPRPANRNRHKGPGKWKTLDNTRLVWNQQSAPARDNVKAWPRLLFPHHFLASTWIIF